MVSKQDMILRVVEKIDSKADKHGERLAGIEQHLSTINGTIERHEELIEANRKCAVKNKISLAKLMGPGIAGGGFVGLIIYLLQVFSK